MLASWKAYCRTRSSCWLLVSLLLPAGACMETCQRQNKLPALNTSRSRTQATSAAYLTTRRAAAAPSAGLVRRTCGAWALRTGAVHCTSVRPLGRLARHLDPSLQPCLSRRTPRAVAGAERQELTIVPFLLGRESGGSQQWRLAADVSATLTNLKGRPLPHLPSTPDALEKTRHGMRHHLVTPALICCGLLLQTCTSRSCVVSWACCLPRSWQLRAMQSRCPSGTR